MSFDLQLVNSDISIKPDGTVRTVAGTAKLKQDIIKIILTPLGSVSFHLWYGSNITDDNIGNILSDARLNENIGTAISESLKRLQQLQRAQSTGQNVKLSEIISTIREIRIQRSSIDQRQVNVVVSVLSRDLTAVEEIFTISG